MTITTDPQGPTVTGSGATQGKRKGQADSSGIGITSKIRKRARVDSSLRPRDETGGSDSSAIPLPLSPNHRLRTLRDGLGGWLRGVGARLHGCSPYTGRPQSIRDVVAYTRAGGWIPGEHAWWWELPGYLYGALIAIPAAIVGNTILWITHRMGRVLVAALIYELLTRVEFAWLIQWPLAHLGWLLLWLAGVQ